jgi:photosystem II stability/assembly factor-like uncharacterized protein
LLVVLGVLVLLAASSGLCWAGDGSGFKTVLDKPVSQVFLSPGFAEDGTAFASVNLPKSGTALYQSKDGGRTWKKIKWLVDNTYREDEEIAELCDMAWLQDGSVLLVGTWAKEGKPFFCISRDNGNRWETVDPDQDAPMNIEPAGSKLLGVFRLDYGSMAMLKESRDGGRTWPSDIKAGVVPYSRSIVALDGSKYFVVLDDNSLWTTADGGKTWRDTGVKLSNLKGEVAAVREASGTETVVACSPGVQAGVYVSRDGGVTWKRVDAAQFEWRPKYSASKAISVAAAPGGLIFAGTPDDCVLVSEDYGATWKPVTEGISDEILDIESASVGNSVVVLAATQDGLLRMEYRKQQEAETAEQQPVEEKQEEGRQQSDEMVVPPVKFVVGQKTYSVGDRVFDMDAEAFTENGRTYVPVRYLGDALGAEIKWDGATQMVTLVKDNVTVKLVVGSKAINVNDQPKQMDVAPLVRGGRTYLPARYVAEAFGYRMGWDPVTQTVSVTK